MWVQEENGGAGVYSADLRKHYMLDNPAWKRDIMPEIIDGKNIMDYVDPDIEAKLEALEMEEEALAAAAAVEVGPFNGCEESVVSLAMMLEDLRTFSSSCKNSWLLKIK